MRLSVVSREEPKVEPDGAATACQDIRKILNRVGDKWSVQVVGVLAEGPRRFSALRRRIEGISQRMLTLTLRVLERDGLVARTVYPTVPPSVEYALTPLGHTLTEPVKALVGWVRQNQAHVQAAREAFDRKKSES